ncbi:MAG TPA: VanZ family protein [Gaiellaceae bacterium]
MRLILFAFAAGAATVLTADATLRGRRPRTAALAATAAILIVTLTPEPGANERQLVPLAEILDALRQPKDGGLVVGVIGNLMLFAPLGAALAAAGVSLRGAVLGGAALSAAVETAQLLVPGRTTAVDDLLLNAAGTALGYIAAATFARRPRTRPTPP